MHKTEKFDTRSRSKSYQICFHHFCYIYYLKMLICITIFIVERLVLDLLLKLSDSTQININGFVLFRSGKEKNW